MTKLFTQRALRQRHRVGEQTGPITLLTPPLRLTIALGVSIAAAGGLWTTLAQIPITVSGTGVLLPVSTINSTSAATTGIAVWMFDQPVQPWQITAERFNRQPQSFDDTAMVALARGILGAATSSIQTAAANRSEASIYARSMHRMYGGERLPAGRLLLWIQSSALHEQLESSLDQLQRELANISEQQSNIRAKQTILTRELASRSSYLKAMGQLAGEGFVSRSSILEEQAQTDNLRSQILANNNDLINLNNQSNRAYQSVRSQLATLVSQELVFAPRPVYLSQVIPNDGEVVSQGETLLSISDDSLQGAIYVPVFLGNKEMAQVFPGMPVLATPSGFRRSEVGGIVGRVISLEKMPSGEADIAARVGSQALTDLVMRREPSPTLAVVALQRDSADRAGNRGGYRWSSPSNLPFLSLIHI